MPELSSAAKTYDRMFWFERFPEVLEKIAKRYGPGKFLGRGSYGLAYLLEDRTVLKITLDEKEAHTSAGLVGKHLKNVVQFFEVLKTPSIAGTGSDKYLIKQEYIPDAVSWAFEDYLGKIKTAVGYWDGGSQEKLMKRFAERMIEEPFKDETLSTDLAIALEELWTNGIVFLDLHGGNMGLKNGHLYVYDLGLSQSPARGQIEELAHRRERYSGIRIRDLLTNTVREYD